MDILDIQAKRDGTLQIMLRSFTEYWFCFTTHRSRPHLWQWVTDGNETPYKSLGVVRYFNSDPRHTICNLCICAISSPLAPLHVYCPWMYIVWYHCIFVNFSARLMVIVLNHNVVYLMIDGWSPASEESSVSLNLI